ncbi:MAG: hypothetical protein ABI920_10135, partial [Casimicrobiaceae bacterium]
SSPQSSPLPPQLPPPLPDQPVVPKAAAPRAEATAPPALPRPFPAAPAAAPSPTAAPDARARDSQDARTVGSTSPAAGASSVHGETKPLPTPPVAADTLRGHARRDGAAPRSMAPPTLESRQAPAPLGTSRPGQAAAAVGMGPSAGPSAAGPSAGSAAKSTAEAPAFADWVAAIEALVRGQRDAEARRELTRLRARYPERLDDLPPALRALLPPG